MAEESKILVIGATGCVGKLLVGASRKAGHPTFALIRESTASNPGKSELIESFKSAGVTVLHGDIYDHESLVKAIKQVDIVISAVGSKQIADQVKIIAAIKEAGNIKRFLPSEFGTDVDRVHAVEPAASFFGIKSKIRRSVEAEGIPYTYIVSNGFAGYFLPNFAQAGATAIFVKEEDIAAYTIKAAVDPRALNKILYMRPPLNILSFNELVSLWEKKIGKTLEKTYILEDDLLKKIQGSPFPSNLFLSFSYCAFVKGDNTNFKIDASFGVEASKLYTEVKYTTIDEYLNQFV